MKIAFGQYSVSPIVTKKPKIDKISINRSHIIIAIVIVVLVADVKVESIGGIGEQKKIVSWPKSSLPNDGGKG